MKRKLKWYIFERVKRLNFIRTELNQLVSKSIVKNTYNDRAQSITVTKNSNFKNDRNYSISYFRLYCMLNLSPKLVNKKFRLSRFSLNKIAKTGGIPGFTKRGW